MNISETDRESTYPQRTLELCLEILLRSKRLRSTCLVSQKVQSEAINNIDDLLCAFIERLILFFGGRVGANVNVISAPRDSFAVNLIDDVVNINHIPCVRDDLVAGDDVLWDG